MGDLGPSNTSFPGPSQIYNQNRISIGSVVFAQFTSECCRTSRGMALPLKIAPSHGGSVPHLIHASLDPPNSTSHMTSRSVQPFLHRWLQKVPLIYNDRPFPPKLPLPTGESGPWFLEPIQAHNPNGISIRAELVLKPKPKPRFPVKTEPKPKPRFWWGSKSILKPHYTAHVTEDMAHSLNDAVFKFFLILRRSTDQPRRVWRSWPHWVLRITPSHSAWLVDIIQQKPSIEVYRLYVLVFSHTGILLHCRDVRILKPKITIHDSLGPPWSSIENGQFR